MSTTRAEQVARLIMRGYSKEQAEQAISEQELVPDVMTITVTSYWDLTEKQKQFIQGRIASTIDCQTIRDLTNRIAEYVHWNSLSQHPIKFATLSRRFNRTAMRLGVTIKEITDDLVALDYCVTRAWHGSLLYYSRYMYDARRAMFADSPKELVEAENRFFSQAE